MRSLKRNKQQLYYALYKSHSNVRDLDGNYTGEYSVSYEKPVAFKANVSANKGEADVQTFGIDLDYTKVISTTEDLPIKEGTRIWQQTRPPTGENNGDSADYYVKQVAKSLNNTLYAIKLVSKNGS